MLTGVAIVTNGPIHDFPGAGIFVIVVIALIVLIFIRVYGGGNQSERRIAHRSRRRKGHRASHSPARTENHQHPPESHHRPRQH